MRGTRYKRCSYASAFEAEIQVGKFFGEELRPKTIKKLKYKYNLGKYLNLRKELLYYLFLRLKKRGHISIYKNDVCVQ